MMVPLLDPMGELTHRACGKTGTWWAPAGFRVPIAPAVRRA